jgi:chorismate synthase
LIIENEQVEARFAFKLAHGPHPVRAQFLSRPLLEIFDTENIDGARFSARTTAALAIDDALPPRFGRGA